MFNWLFKYGEVVEGYDVRVINEREARAAAGILFVFGILSLLNAVMLGHGIVTRYFISFFTLDFLIRVINQNYSPSLMLGRFFVQNQTPEYVGAAQKRFAWMLGLILALPMFYLLVIHWQPNPIKLLVCIICLILLFLESAFSICLGCKIYNMIMSSKAKHCPGGVCELKRKEKIQTFSIAQKIILFMTVSLIAYALYAYTYKINNKTHFSKMIVKKLMSKAELERFEELEYQKMMKEFDEED